MWGTFAHVLFSVFLHISGISTGLWIWYLFPRNPTRSVTRYPARHNAVTAKNTELYLPLHELAHKQTIVQGIRQSG
uniref:Secreted protein n=1 Tax=Steinernema glaseri TaxID=37863 RepID=A0A1I8A3W9_9BILA